MSAVAHFDDYFSTVKRLCGPGGYAMIHAIGACRTRAPPRLHPQIHLPGGYVPALSEVFASTERCGLWVDDCEVLRLHYYWTIKAWRENFEACATRSSMQGERFARMWEFYLAPSSSASATAPTWSTSSCSLEKRDAVPVTRDFITAAEEGLKAREGVLPW